MHDIYVFTECSLYLYASKENRFWLSLGNNHCNCQHNEASGQVYGEDVSLIYGNCHFDDLVVFNLNF